VKSPTVSSANPASPLSKSNSAPWLHCGSALTKRYLPVYR
jgi:hypothetical protein